MTEIVMDDPLAQRDAQREKDHSRIWPLGEAPGSVYAGVMKILPPDAKDVEVQIRWNGSQLVREY